MELQCCSRHDPNGAIKVEVVPKVDVVSRQGTVELDIVVLCKVGKVNCRSIARRGKIKVYRFLERAVKRGRSIVVCDRDGSSDGVDVNLSAIAREVAVICQSVESRAGGPT